MKLEHKKHLAARALNVGKNRIIFNTARLSEIKEAITKQDMKDLNASGAVHIKQVTGRKTVQKRKTRRRAGSIRHRAINKKTRYITITRKLRSYLRSMRLQNKVSPTFYKQLRKEIRNSNFRSLAYFKERIAVGEGAAK